MTITLNALQKQRRDTASNWTSNNPTLLDGELGYETDTKKFKIGDGSTAWQSLDYLPIPDTNRLLAGNLTVGGDFQVNGTTTTVNTTNLDVKDRNITLNKVTSPSDTLADGGGITLKAASDKTITWSNANDSWDFNQNINAASTYAYRINNVSVLNATTLGSSVVNSSLTSVGTITSGVWNGTAITKSNLASLDIVNADVNASAAIAGTKISPDFGSQNISTTANLTVSSTTTLGGELNLMNGSTDAARIIDASIGTNDFLIRGCSGGDANHVTMISAKRAAEVALNYSGQKKFETTSAGATVTGSLGIGTTAPTNLLDVRADATSTKVHIGSSDGSLGNMPNSSEYGISLAGNNAEFQLHKDGSGNYKLVLGTYQGSVDIPLVFRTGSRQERLRISSAGRVGIGTDSMACALHVKHASNNELLRLESGDQYAHMVFKDSGSTNDVLVGADGDDLRISTGGYERFRMDDTGDVSIGQIPTPNKLTVNDSQAYKYVQNINNETWGYGLWVGVATESSSRYGLEIYSTETGVDEAKALIGMDGTFKSRNNTYGGFSDIKLKENIVDAKSQWNDIKAIKLRNFNFKKDDPSKKMLGVVAQELETVCPNLVRDIPDTENKDGKMVETGTVTKEVKYSIIYLKAIKALQEAIAKIEVLETKVAALEAA